MISLVGSIEYDSVGSIAMELKRKRQILAGAVAAVAVILIAALSRAAVADPLEEFSNLAFPTEPNEAFDHQRLDSVNSLGVVKLSAPLKICAFGTDAASRNEVEAALRAAAEEYPEAARRFLDLNCSAFSSIDADHADVAVWVTNEPRHDVMKYLDGGKRVGWPNYLTIVDEFELSDSIFFPAVSITNSGKTIRGLYLVKEEGRYIDKVNSLVGSFFGFLNPKSIISRSNPHLLGNLSDQGKLKLTDLSIRYLKFLYSDAVENWDSKSKFVDAATQCFREHRC